MHYTRQPPGALASPPLSPAELPIGDPDQVGKLRGDSHLTEALEGLLRLWGDGADPRPVPAKGGVHEARGEEERERGKGAPAKDGPLSQTLALGRPWTTAVEPTSPRDRAPPAA